jgi:hypothetical protein
VAAPRSVPGDIEARNPAWESPLRISFGGPDPLPPNHAAGGRASSKSARNSRGLVNSAMVGLLGPSTRSKGHPAGQRTYRPADVSAARTGPFGRNPDQRGIGRAFSPCWGQS